MPSPKPAAKAARLVDAAGKPMPEFLIIGAGKSGTTSLASVLRTHPQLFLPDNKEPQFFILGAPEGLDVRGYASWEKARQSELPIVPYTIVHSREEYLALFDEAQPGQLRGEASPPYLYDPNAAERIHAANPAAKLILILRNPVDRAFSHYTRRFEFGTDSGRDFEAVVASEDVQKRPFFEGPRHFVRMGFYHQQLARYLKFFPPEQIHVMLFEDYLRNFESSIAGVLGFLGVDYQPGALSIQRENATESPKNRNLHRALAHPSRLRSLVLKVQPSFIRKRIRRLGAWLRERNMQGGSKPAMNPETRKALLAVYADDIRQLGQYLQRDLSKIWK